MKKESQSVPSFFFENELVPKFEILSDEEKQKLLEKYRCTLEQLPKILVTDPIVRYLNAKPGDVIKFIRESPVAGKSLYYRVVTEV
ncbi:MAG: DNA-directed RNA polymerase subunit H [Candidatus Korarchaeota archaeon]